MENEQVSNTSIEDMEVTESSVPDDAMGDFFGDLDRSLNGGILDMEVSGEKQETSENVSDNTHATPEVQQEDVEPLKKDNDLSLV